MFGCQAGTSVYSLVGAAQCCGYWSIPLPCVPSPFPLFVSISCTIAMFACGSILHCVSVWGWVGMNVGVPCVSMQVRAGVVGNKWG
jgi:hypothetical protein